MDFSTDHLDESVLHSPFNSEMEQEGLDWTLPIVSLKLLFDVLLCFQFRHHIINACFCYHLYQCQCSRRPTHDASNRLGSLERQGICEMGQGVRERCQEI